MTGWQVSIALSVVFLFALSTALVVAFIRLGGLRRDLERVRRNLTVTREIFDRVLARREAWLERALRGGDDEGR